MRIALVFLLFFVNLLGFELVLNSGREDNRPFFVLHAKNELDFSCIQKSEDARQIFECEIPGIVENELKNQSFSAFDLKFSKNEKSISMKIYPKVEAKMFDLSQDIFSQTSLPSSENNKSKGFTFIFMDGFFSHKQYDGLDFNIDFPHQVLPFVGALDLNSNPVVIPQSADINTYIRIKSEYEKDNFAQVVTDATNAIARYKNSIFMSEFILYKLRAQDKIYNENIDARDRVVLEKMIDDAKAYNRTYVSDKNYPEILQIMLKTYISLASRSDVEYTMGILQNEQPNSEFTELAGLDYGDYLYNLGEKEKGVAIYENSYYNTKNKDLAARAALSLAKDSLSKGEINKAQEFVDTIFRANASYFSKDSAKALDLAKAFYNATLYDSSAKIYEKSFEGMSKIDANYEVALKDLAIALAKSSNPAQAKKYLDLYSNEFLDGAYLPAIQKANDEIFFALNESNSTLLHQRFKELIQKYGEIDENLAAKALEEDIKLYHKEGDFTALLSFKNDIESSQNPRIISLLEDVALKSLSEHLKADNCIAALQEFNTFSSYDLGQKVADKKKMLECLIRTSNTQQALAYIDKNAHEDSIHYGLQKAGIEFDNKNYRQSINLAKTVLNERVLKSDEESFRAYYLQFLANLKLDNYNEAMRLLRRLESYPMSFTMVEAYDALISYANERDMQTSILSYAPKAIDYQNLRGINLFSPNLEFIYLASLQKVGQNEKALEVLVDLLKLKLSNDERARAFYLQSLSYEALGNVAEQKQSLNSCISLEGNSQWKNLCLDKNALLGSK